MLTESMQEGIKYLKNVLDGMVTANGLFTAAVFLGVTGTVTPLSSLPKQCVAGDDINRMLFVFEVGSFGCYILSSIIAQGLKLDIFYQESTHRQVAKIRCLRLLMSLSVGFSLAGSVLLLLSIIELIQIKLGLYSCGQPLVAISAIIFTVLMSSGIFLYGIFAYRLLMNLNMDFSG